MCVYHIYLLKGERGAIRDNLRRIIPRNCVTLKILVLLLLLPLVLSACGGGKTDNAKNFLEGVFEGDGDKAKENACDDLHPVIDLVAGAINESGEDVDVSVDCEEDGDDVKCTVEADGESEEITLTMDDDDKVCGDLSGLTGTE